jgi:asparagine synthase (glutamine-hydrolysing)
MAGKNKEYRKKKKELLMCGIFGYFSCETQITHEQITQALENIRHRGPDSAGVMLSDGRSASFFPDRQVPEGSWDTVLAHTRLSIIDLSDAGRQPMSNEDDTVWVVYNGEIYNFIEIREALLSKGHTFKSRTDSEVIVHGYEEWGGNVVDSLRGMFAFAIFDRLKNTLVLARDRLGVKPLKYYWDRKTLAFASELRAMMHLVSAGLDNRSVNTFLTLKYIPSPDTILRDVKKVRPGQVIEFDLGRRTQDCRTYWKPAFYPKTRLSYDEAKDQLKNILSESVLMRTLSDVPIGVYLSGGMDSSAMVAFLKEGGVDSINTFTMKFNRTGYDESVYAQSVADHFRTRHHEFEMPELTYENLVGIIHSLDEPYGDPSYIPTYFLSGFTSEHVKVILSGDGGDELMGGYKRYHIHARGRVLDLLPRIPSGFVRRLPPVIDKKSPAGRIQRIAEQLSFGYWGAYLLRFSGFSDSFKRYVLRPEVYASIDELSINAFFENEDFQRISDVIERLIWIDFHTYLPDYILTKTDLALMAHSVEGRNPFVDYRLVEFVNMLPPAYKFKGGGKHILKAVLKNYLPVEVMNRKKMGFSPPIKYWFRENPDLLYEFFSKADFVSADLFELDQIHKAIDRFQTSEMNISEQLWLIMVLELWRRTYNV